MRRQADSQDHGRDHRRVCVCSGRDARALGAHPAADTGARAPPRPCRAASCAQPGCRGCPDAVQAGGARPISAPAGGVSGRLSAGSLPWSTNLPTWDSRGVIGAARPGSPCPAPTPAGSQVAAICWHI